MNLYDVRTCVGRFGASDFTAQERQEAAALHAPDAAWKAFRLHVNSAKQRGIPFNMTFREWWAWWLTDGRWKRRGRGRQRLHMARYGDTGAYEVGNVYCATSEQNHQDVTPPVRSRAATRAWETVWASGRESHLTIRETHPKGRCVVTPAGVFPSASLAADAYGITGNAAAYRARQGRMGWYYAE